MADAAKEAEEAAKKEKEEELAAAVKDNKAEDVQRLLEDGVSADAKDSIGQPALMWAGLNGNDKALRLLKDAGANLEAGLDGFTSLLASSMKGQAS